LNRSHLSTPGKTVEAAMRMERTSEFDAPAAALADFLFDPQTMMFLLRPVVRVAPLTPPVLPPRWQNERYRVAMYLFGIIPLGWQDIVVTDILCDPERGAWGFRDDGVGRLARRWDHRTLLEALPDGRSRYTDTVEVEAGLVTPAAWMFAWLVFAWRHRRWRPFIRQKHFPQALQGPK
jgi:hypothetical protein